MTEELDKLDRLAAEHVMGWEIPNERPELAEKLREWQPTRRIEQAWECLEKFKHHNNMIVSHDRGYWRCDLTEGYETDEIIADADTAPLSIVMACLKAKGVEIE